jgi:RNA polymerase sigma-70 factor (ECF subfamily)
MVCGFPMTCILVDDKADAVRKSRFVGSATNPQISGLEAVLLVHRPALLRFFTSRTRDPAEAEEVLQEIFLRLGRVGPGPIGDPIGYIYRIGLNLVVDRARARQRRTRREEAWGEATTSKLGDDLVDERPSPFAQAAARQRSERIAGVLASMPPGAARAFRMHKIEGLTHREVAERLGITRKGVEKHMTVAFRHLAEELQE